MNNFRVIFHATFLGYIRDKLVQLLLGCALLIFLIVPALSVFSMRQVQELSVTISLAAISLVLLMLTVILGSSSVWRDLDRRYLASILGLPVSRTSYLIGKFVGIMVFIIAGCLFLGVVATIAIKLSAAQYPSEIPLQWSKIWLAICGDGMKFILVAAFAILFSALSTSFYFPFVTTLIIYFCGSASQEVYEYIIGDYGKHLSALTRNSIIFIYYCIPNFAAFDFKVQAVYALPISVKGVMFIGGYFLLYTCIVLMIAVWAFNRRELA